MGLSGRLHATTGQRGTVLPIAGPWDPHWPTEAAAWPVERRHAHVHTVGPMPCRAGERHPFAGHLLDAQDSGGASGTFLDKLIMVVSLRVFGSAGQVSRLSRLAGVAGVLCS